MRNRRAARTLILALVLLLVVSSPAGAWQVMSHQIVAVRAAEAMNDGDPFKSVLLSNQVYLRAGSMGPDIFYMSARAGFSDLAHYCRTDKLAESMLDLAERRSDRARAFAYGWFSHNIADSVAHPWVNGFTGHPYVDFPADPGNLTHMGIEGWVNKRIASEGQPDAGQRASLARAGYDAFFVYINDGEIQELVVEAYEKTYAQDGCGGKKFAPLSKDAVSEAGRNFMAVLAGLGFGDFLLDVLDPEILDLELKKLFFERLDDIQKVRNTWADYVDRTVRFIGGAWLEPKKLEDFNLDQGVTRENENLADIWQDVLGADGTPLNVFNTPGTNYVSDGGQPGYQPRCEEKKKDKKFCDDMTMNPGGDRPDDAVAAGEPSAGTPRDAYASLIRLALKKGKRWPVHMERLRRQAEELRDVTEPVAFLQGFAALGRSFDDARAGDPEYSALASTYQGDEAPWRRAADVALFNKGFASRAEALLDSVLEPTMRVDPEDIGPHLASEQPVLLVPTGGLHGLTDSESIRAGFESYVAAGGTLVVFAQQRGPDFSVLPMPDGAPIEGYGWLEDQSCNYQGSFIDKFHPVLASQRDALVSWAVDGYFTKIPTDAIVLLRRVRSSAPVMFAYRYAAGWVIVTSSYDDWGGFNQSGPGAHAIVRDMIAWAKRPEDLTIHRPGDTASVALPIRNLTDSSATQVRLSLMSPSRHAVVSQRTEAISIGPGQVTELTFTHTLATNADLGIYHVDYTLLDDAGQVVQPQAEDDQGRIVVASAPANPYRPQSVGLDLVVVGDDHLFADDPIPFRYTVTNRSSEERTFRLYRNWTGKSPEFLEELTLPGHTALVRDLPLPPPSPYGGGGALVLHAFEVGGVPHYGNPVAGETAAYQLSVFKSVRRRMPQVSVNAQSDKQVYGWSDDPILAVRLVNYTQFQLPVNGFLRVKKADEVVLERAVSIPGGGETTVSIPVPLPPRDPSGRTYLAYTVEVTRGTHLAGSDGVFAQIVEPELRSLGLVAPLWSRTSANHVEWSLSNARAVSMPSGSVRAAVLSDAGAELWSETRPVALAANGSAVVAFDVPQIPLAAEEVVLTADNGFGQTVEARSDLRSRLLAVARLSAPDFGAGDSGEVVLTLKNQGRVLESGAAMGSIEGLGDLALASYSLAPGHGTALTFAFSVPASVVGGLHAGRLTLPSGQEARFTVPIRPARIELAVGGSVFRVGEAVPVVVRNVGGSQADADVGLSSFDERAETAAHVVLDVGAETTVQLPAAPGHLPSGTYYVVGEAVDRRAGTTAKLLQRVQLLGTAASLTVATDQNLYAPSAPLQATAQLVNAGTPLAAGGLHLEIVTPCSAIGGGEGSYHVDTWDGSDWVERAVRHRQHTYETDQVDLAPFLPDAGGEYKVRIRQTNLWPASLDYVGLISGGALIAPIEARQGGVMDVLATVAAADDVGIDIFEGSVVVRFSESPAPSLVFRAREGEIRCDQRTLWQKDYPLDLAEGDQVDVAEALTAPSEPGQYLLRGSVRTRDGDLLAGDEKVFEVVEGDVSLSLDTEEHLYRLYTQVPARGVVRNLSLAALPDLTLLLYRKDTEFDWGLVYETSLELDASEARPYEVHVEALNPEMNLRAEVRRSGILLAASEWSFRAGEPMVGAGFTVPDPVARLASTSPRLASVTEDQLDAVTHTDDGFLDGPLPFPLVLGGWQYVSFRQSVDGFVELVPDWQGGPLGAQSSCLDGFGDATVLAAFLGDLDASSSGFVGHKFYAAGSADGMGEILPEDTLVFIWDAPGKGDARHNRLQIRISRDGLIRLDAGEVFLTSSCDRTGLAMPFERLFAFGGAAPFGARVETGVGRKPFRGSIEIFNEGTYPATVSLDYGRRDGPRQVETLTLDPDEFRTLFFDDQVAAPTLYTLSVTGDLVAGFEQAVAPSETLVVEYRGEARFEPGRVALPFTLTKLGGVGAPVSVTYELTGAGGPQSLTHTYDLEPGIRSEDAIDVDLPEGSSLVDATADVPLVAAPVGLVAGPEERVSIAASAGALSGSVLPVVVDLANTGLDEFSAELQVEGLGTLQTRSVSLAAGTSARFELPVDLSFAEPGPQTLAIRLVSDAGMVVADTSLERNVDGPRLALVASPSGETFDLTPQGAVPLRFVVRNDGDRLAVGVLTFTVFDEEFGVALDLDAGDEEEAVFDLPVDADAGEGAYVGRYVLETRGGPSDSAQVSFTVRGIALTVNASLDRDSYADGETARLTVDVENGRPGLGTDYVARVHYADFEETREFSVPGSATLVFDVPLTQVTGEPVFLGITHPDGRSLYINTFHVRRADGLVTVTVDRQVYEPGSGVTVSVLPTSAGSISLAAPGYSESFEVTGSTTRGFTLPADLPGGTYFVDWSFTGSGTATASGQVPFDVSGLQVRVFEADLDRGRYESGEDIGTRLRIHTNQAAAVTLRAFVLDPEGLSQAAGEKPLALDPAADLVTEDTWGFATAVAGLHRFVYGIYQGEQLLASGSLAFDVGGAAVLGIRTDKTDYPVATEPVLATVAAFVSAPATLRVELGGELAASREVTATGIVEVPVTLDSVPPGSHELAAVMESGAYTSRRTTSFRYGTSLPDLAPGVPTARPFSGAGWKLDVAVTNVGPTAAAATTLDAFDKATGSLIGTVSAPALPAGASAVVALDWNVSGLAGVRDVEVVADAGGSIVEFREDNNRTTGTIAIPEVVVQAVAAGAYEANTEAALSASVTNLTADATQTGLSVAPTVTGPDGVVVSLPASGVGDLQPGATVSVGTPWPVGRSAPGRYVLATGLLDAAGTVLGKSLAFFDVLTTHAFSGSVTATPNPASPEAAVSFAGRIQNQGNASATGTARFDVVASDGTIAARAATPADVPREGAVEVAASLDPLGVSSGDYRLDLRMEVGDREYPVATSTLAVEGAGVEATLTADLTPRVLVYVGGHKQDHDGRARRKAFVDAALAGTGALWTTTADPLEFGILMRSGRFNTHVVMTDVPALLPLIADELREAVFRGEGLVLAQWRSGPSPNLEPALGAKIHGQVPGKSHTLKVIDGPLGPAFTVSLGGSATRIEPKGATLAGMLDSYPSVTTHAYGKGRSVALSFDPAVAPQDPARPALEGFFARAVAYAAPDEAKPVAAGTVVPLALTLDNPTGSTQHVETVVSLPPGLTLVAADDDPLSTEPLTWILDLPAGDSRSLRFLVALPDQTGSYEVTAAVRVNGVPLAPPPATVLQVPRTVEQALAGAIAMLETTEVAHEERGHLRAAICLLRAAMSGPSNRTGLEVKIRHAAEAGEKLGRISSANVSVPRTDVDHVIAAWERAWLSADDHDDGCDDDDCDDGDGHEEDDREDGEDEDDDDDNRPDAPRSR